MLNLAKRRESSRRWRQSEKGRAWRALYLPGRAASISDQNRRYREAHRDDLNKKNRQLRQRRKADPIEAPLMVRKKMLRDAEKRAAVRGVPFRITLADIPSASRCPALGIELNWHRSKPGPDSPSLDRIVNAAGYVPGNVWVISRRANTIKLDAAPDELRAVADAVERVLRAREFAHV